MYAEDKINQTSTSPVKRPPQVRTAFEELEHTLEDAHKTASELEARLQPLLRSEPEAAVDSQKEARTTLVPLAENIEGYTRQLRVIINTQQSILRRLEL